MPTRKHLFVAVLGCAVPLALVVAGLLALLGAAVPYVVALLVLLAAIPFVAVRRRRWSLVKKFRATHGAAGKDLLLVYTDSPHWKEYIESNWIPRWSDRAVVLNRSTPWTATRVEAQLWLNMAGSVEHTPVAIVVPRTGSPEIVRFWLAFRDYKHGKSQRLHDAEARLAALLDRSPRGP